MNVQWQVNARSMLEAWRAVTTTTGHTRGSAGSAPPSTLRNPHEGKTDRQTPIAAG